jgi:hypothetical protein
MGVDVMRPVFNSVPKFRVTLLTREEWIRGLGTPPAVKGLIWYTDRSRMLGGARARDYGQSLGRRLSICPGKYAAVFQAKKHAILACVYKILMNDRQGKYISISSDVRRL